MQKSSKDIKWFFKSVGAWISVIYTLVVNFILDSIIFLVRAVWWIIRFCWNGSVGKTRKLKPKYKRVFIVISRGVTIWLVWRFVVPANDKEWLRNWLSQIIWG
jgi:hypothetical protein